MKLLRSLRVRLLLMFMFVVIVTLATVAFVQAQATANAFQDYTNNAKRIDQVRGRIGQMIDSILIAYRAGDSKSVQIQMMQVATENEVRIILVNSNNRIVLDSNDITLNPVKTASKLSNAPSTPVTSGTQLTPALLETSSLPVILISTNTTLPHLVPTSLPSGTTSTTLAQNFLNAIAHSLWIVIVLAWLLALLLTLALSNRILKPVRELTRVANHMEQGDLSQRVRIRTQDEMGKLAHAFNTMADSLAHSEQLRRNLVSDVAHELRTPLTNIRGYLEALRDHVIDPTGDMIASLYDESLLLSRLVVDLQELSLAEAGQLRLARRQLSPDEVLIQAVSALQLQAEAKQLALHVDLPACLPRVEADAERVGQVLRNLLSNAIIHTPPGGTITVSACIHEDEVLVSVQDTGAGIEAQHLPYIFERFYRADSSRSRTTGGTGLGLAIVKQVVEAHGGHVAAESTPGRGSSFTFSLPVACL
ncbi:MAG TPA: ATP-binding protein [Ktedonobacteraceae bacterium]|nr:ATP-binding protein [Ktedonobacteraceae bacterium]